jgi:hypothetical protein
MIEKIVNLLFRWGSLREAIMDEVYLYDTFGRIMRTEANSVASTFWAESDGWRGWTYNESMNRYFFNDIPENGMIEAWQELETLEGAIHIANGE